VSDAPRVTATRRTYAVVTGGGTGGHVTPALAIADALVAHGHPRDAIRFVGARRGLEARAVPAAGYDVELLALDGIQRSFAPRDLLRSLRAVLAFVRALGHCVRTLRRERPAVVVGVGGYASAPCVLAARLVRVPTVVHEQNAVPGIVNRLAVALGARPAVSFPSARWRRAVITGNPVRTEVAATRWAPVMPPQLAVVGGSLGAGRLNDVALGLYDRWRARSDVAIRHVAGPKHAERCRARLAELRRPDDRLRYELVDFEHDMPALYGASALVLCRSGATTVAEVAAVGVPTVLVPWSGSAEGQQDANAAALVGAGAGVVVADVDCTVATVEPIVAPLLVDAARRTAMAEAARGLGRPDAAARVCALIEECARAA
jgi:UDP-N-acetylglucosamine--N-acetylmuramyl-(pentapeptide) pyrophosphoryl-undecaprenol N-acetylglucosamine transferase